MKTSNGYESTSEKTKRFHENLNGIFPLVGEHEYMKIYDIYDICYAIFSIFNDGWRSSGLFELSLVDGFARVI